MIRSWLIAGSVLLATAAVSCAPSSETGTAEQETAETELAAHTYEGVLVDTKCYSMNSVNSGDDHETPDGKMAACATACAKMGIPVGLLVDGEADGQLMVLIAPVAPLSDHMAAWARVTGQPSMDGQALVPEKLEVRGADGTYTEVQLATMM